MATLLAKLGIHGGIGTALILLLAITPGLALSHPAIALCGGALCALLLGDNLVAEASRYAKLALQAAIVLLGFTMNAAVLLELSATFSGAVTAYVLCTGVIGALLMWMLGVDRVTGTLLTIGTAICGATAIAAAAPFLKTPPQKQALALGVVFLLNMVALFAFPAIGQALNLTDVEFGAVTALAVHDTSSVVATAAVFSGEAQEVATTLKLGRTLWLIPLVVLLAMWAQGEKTQDAVRRASVPGFVLLFVAAAIFSSFVTLPEVLVDGMKLLAKSLLVVALFFVGLGLSRSTFASLRLRDALFAVALWCAVIPLAYGLVQWAI